MGRALKTFACSLGVAVWLGVAGCPVDGDWWHDDDDVPVPQAEREPGPMERAGERIDRWGRRARDEVRDDAERFGDWVEDKTDIEGGPDEPEPGRRTDPEQPPAQPEPIIVR